MAHWAHWGWGVWVLHGVAVVHFALFVAYFVRFKRLRAAVTTDEASVVRYNRAIRGFPGAFYAKMMGCAKLEGASETLGDEPAPIDST